MELGKGAGRGVLAGAFRRQVDGDFGRSRGRARLRLREGVWGRETLRLRVGVDAVAGADANLQRARGGISWAHRVQAIVRARAPRRGRHSPVTRVDNVGINRTTVGSARGRSAGAGPDSAGPAGPSRSGQRTGIVWGAGGDHQRCACTGPGRKGKYRAG